MPSTVVKDVRYLNTGSAAIRRQSWRWLYTVNSACLLSDFHDHSDRIEHLPVKISSLRNHTFAPSTTMCDIRIKTYRECGRNPPHNVRGEYLRCAQALARPNQKPCVPLSGSMRDLPLSLDVHDTNIRGECPMCAGHSAPNSSD